VFAMTAIMNGETTRQPDFRFLAFRGNRVGLDSTSWPPDRAYVAINQGLNFIDVGTHQPSAASTLTARGTRPAEPDGTTGVEKHLIENPFRI